VFVSWHCYCIVESSRTSPEIPGHRGSIEQTLPMVKAAPSRTKGPRGMHFYIVQQVSSMRFFIPGHCAWRTYIYSLYVNKLSCHTSWYLVTTITNLTWCSFSCGVFFSTKQWYHWTLDQLLYTYSTNSATNAVRRAPEGIKSMLTRSRGATPNGDQKVKKGGGAGWTKVNSGPVCRLAWINWCE